MTEIKMKIIGYDESSNSLCVAFAGENSERSVDEYPVCAYQPSMYNTKDPEEIIQHIARSGIHVAEMQAKNEEYRRDQELIRKLKEYVGKELTFRIDELIATAPQTVESYVQSASIIDEILEEIVIENDFTNDTQEKPN